MQPSIRAAAIQIGAHNTNPRTFEPFGRSVHKLRSPGLHGIRCGSSLLISEVKKCTAQPITLRSLSLSTRLGFRPDLRWSTDCCASQDGRSRHVKSCLASLNRRLNPVTPAPARPRNGDQHTPQGSRLYWQRKSWKTRGSAWSGSAWPKLGDHGWKMLLDHLAHTISHGFDSRFDAK